MYSWYYYKTDGEVDYIRPGNSEVVNNLDWVAYKQHFFTSNLLSDTPFINASLSSSDLITDEKIDTVFTKNYELKAPLALTGGEFNYNMKWFYGPSDYNLLKKYDFIIIGGGASGLGCALDASSRGYSVVLLEKFDFCKGTSSRSTKLIHGGVRYLEKGQIGLVYEAVSYTHLTLPTSDLV